HRLERDLGGQIGVAHRVEDAGPTRSEQAILGQRAARLAPKPPRGGGGAPGWRTPGGGGRWWGGPSGGHAFPRPAPPMPAGPGGGITPVDTGSPALEDVGMRPHDDDDPAAGTADESLADGLGPTREEGGFSTSTDPYGDAYDDGGYGDTYDEDDDDLGEDDGVDDTYGTDSSYGDGSDDPDDTEVDDNPITDDTDDSVLVPDEPGAGDDFAETAHAGSPFEGIGFLLDEIGDPLFGGAEDDVGRD